MGNRNKFRNSLLATAAIAMACGAGGNVKFGQKDAGGSKTPPAPPAPGKPDDASVTADELQKRIKAAVDASLAAHTAGGKQLTGDDVKAIVEAALAKVAPPAPPAPPAPAPPAPPAPGAPPALSQKEINDLVTKAVTDAMAGMEARFPNRTPGAPTGGSKYAGHEIEVPYSLCKGNLPLHMKQLLNVAMGRAMNDGVTPEELRDGNLIGDRMLSGVKTVGAKALTPSSAVDWIPRDISAELQRRLYLNSEVARAFMADEINMPTETYDYPLIKATGDFYLDTVGGDGSDATPSDPEIGKLTLVARTFRGMRQLTDNAEEDSIIAILPELERDLADSAARAYENALINGDTTAPHMDSDVTNTKDARKAWKGFRKLALAGNIKSDLTSGGLTRANLTALKKLLGKWGVSSQNLLWIWGPMADATLGALDEFALAYARGGPTTFTDGALKTAPYGGTWAVSEACRENLNASGVYDGSTTTKGSILVLHKPSFKVGYRRQFRLELEKKIRSGTWDIVASFRRAFTPVETPSTTLSLCGVGYNYNA